MVRLALAFGLLSAWLLLLLVGWSFGGWVYLLLVASLVVFPWSQLREDPEPPPEAPSPP